MSKLINKIARARWTGLVVAIASLAAFVLALLFGDQMTLTRVVTVLFFTATPFGLYRMSLTEDANKARFGVSL